MRLSSILMTVVLTACGTERSTAPIDAQRSDRMAQDDSTGGVHVTITIETLYQIDDVLVVVENGNGPDQGQMLEAVHRFRCAASEMFELGAEECDIWRSINEIRWDAEPVPPDGGVYDPEAAKLQLEYHGCTVESPLYRLLATHYYHEMTGETDLPDTTVQWVDDLSGANMSLCAP
jgi:hypothetical protein